MVQSDYKNQKTLQTVGTTILSDDSEDELHTFQNEVVSRTKDQIVYKHFIEFDTIAKGSCFGYRSLLDKQVIRRNIIDEVDNLSAQLEITKEDVIQ